MYRLSEYYIVQTHSSLVGCLYCSLPSSVDPSCPNCRLNNHTATFINHEGKNASD